MPSGRIHSSIRRDYRSQCITRQLINGTKGTWLVVVAGRPVEKVWQIAPVENTDFCQRTPFAPTRLDTVIAVTVLLWKTHVTGLQPRTGAGTELLVRKLKRTEERREGKECGRKRRSGGGGVEEK